MYQAILRCHPHTGGAIRIARIFKTATMRGGYGKKNQQKPLYTILTNINM